MSVLFIPNVNLMTAMHRTTILCCEFIPLDIVHFHFAYYNFCLLAACTPQSRSMILSVYSNNPNKSTQDQMWDDG